MKKLLLPLAILLCSISAFGTSVKLEVTSKWSTLDTPENSIVENYVVPLGEVWTLPSQEGRELNYRFKINYQDELEKGGSFLIEGEIFVKEGDEEKVVGSPIVFIKPGSTGTIYTEDNAGGTWILLIRFLSEDSN